MSEKVFDLDAVLVGMRSAALKGMADAMAGVEDEMDAARARIEELEAEVKRLKVHEKAYQAVTPVAEKPSDSWDSKRLKEELETLRKENDALMGSMRGFRESSDKWMERALGIELRRS